MLQGAGVSRVKNNQHDMFVQRIVRERLLGNLSVLRGTNFQIYKSWRELFFLGGGIVAGSCRFLTGVRDNYGHPDLMIVTTNPNYLLVVEAKVGKSHDALDKMDCELERYRDYIEDRPENLCRFLSSEGLSDEMISGLEIGFAGVIPTQGGRGLRERVYFGLFEKNK